jgi:hypothetical protein
MIAQSQLRNTICLRTLILAAIALLVLAAASNIQAVTIQIDLGNPGTLTTDRTVAFDDLNGTSLLGQNLSVDFNFANDEFVRLFTVTSISFGAFITLQTDGSGLVGFLDGTGYLVDQQGNPLQSPQPLGSASGSDGSMSAGLFPLLSGELSRPLDFYGVHYDLTFPLNPPVDVTAGEFRLFSDTGPFGIGPGLPPDIVPDSGSTLLLVGIGLLGGIGLRSMARLGR